jgi:peptidoglycan/LPS O-acetylase OafA/YrhL
MEEKANRYAWLDHLRSFVTLLVVAHHAALAYTTFAYFKKEAYILSTHPVVDTRRWKGLDIFVDFNDVFFMSLLYLVSGFFVRSSLDKKGIAVFIRDRFYRLFLPFLTAVTVLMPVAYYPAYRLAHGSGSLKAYLADFFTTEAWPVGPPWFIWVLFVFNIVFAAGYACLRRHDTVEHRQPALRRQRPFLYLFAWLVYTWLAYVPLVLFTGVYQWTGIGPFDFQVSRVVLYAAYFFLGTLFSRPPLRHLFDKGAAFVQKWPLWLALCLVAYTALKLSEAPLSAMRATQQLSAVQVTFIYRSIWSACCTLNCICFLCLFKTFADKPVHWWKLLSANAYGIYLVHYIFVLYCQYFLLQLHWPAQVKFLVVFFVSLLLSWLAVAFCRKNNTIRRYV